MPTPPSLLLCCKLLILLRCDCNCGAIDIDCAFCFQQYTSCDFNASSYANSVIGAVAIGIVCNQPNEILLSGDALLRGFSGDPSKLGSALQCPGDKYYGGSPVSFNNAVSIHDIK